MKRYDELVYFKLSGDPDDGPYVSACRVCVEENDRFFAAGGKGTRKVPEFVAGGPEAQKCEHLAEFVRRLEREGVLKKA